MGDNLQFMNHIRFLLNEVVVNKRMELLDMCSVEELRAMYCLFKSNKKIEEPLVSVLLATYKTNEKHLRQCVDSILSQTYGDFELLIYDDCPPDTSVEKIVKSYSDKRIVYYHQNKDKGIAGNRNDLMAAAKGKYMAVMDHDDVMMPERIERQVIYMELNPTIGICGSAYKRFGLWNKRGVVQPSVNSNEIKAGLFFKCTMHHPSIMMRSDLIKKYKISYDKNYISANDRHLYLDMMPYAEFHNLPQILMKYRMHGNMTSKTKRTEIEAEQKRLRQWMLSKIGIKLSDEELDTLNNYVLKGRCRIKKKSVLDKVEKVLFKIDNANQKSGYFPKDEFSKLCAKYFVKRCLNAAIWGHVSSKELLEHTKLNINTVKIPTLLKWLNLLLPEIRIEK